MEYICLRFLCQPEEAEILMAMLAEDGFESFEEENGSLNAYIQQALYNEDDINFTLEVIGFRHLLSQKTVIKKQNWNAEWEKNFEPVIVADRCLIKAYFHTDLPEYEYEITITPKMSFGTGHHSTTALMIEQQLTIDHVGKTVMDAGCGTGILAIMAAKLGASYINAFDIDDWAVENAIENVAINGYDNIDIWQGDASGADTTKNYDIILANINRNILMQEMCNYAKLMHTNSLLVMSGFYETDVQDIAAIASAFGIKMLRVTTRNQWASLLCQMV